MLDANTNPAVRIGVGIAVKFHEEMADFARSDLVEDVRIVRRE